ncbi:MAG: YHS domain-containing protein [bacterium]|nr:YHS domain-containing protein [bacterium]
MQNKIKDLIKKISRFGYDVKPKNKKHIDPVCGMDATSDFFKSEYKGKTYYFCSEHCKKQFDEKPDNFIVAK